MKDTILFINSASSETVSGIKGYGEKKGIDYKVAVIRDSKKKNWTEKAKENGVDFLLNCDLKNPIKIQKAILPYLDRIAAVSCRGEAAVHWLAKVIPHVPYVRTATAASLSWATDKIMMREMFRIYNKKITPKFLVISDNSLETIQKVKEKVGFPLVLKPAGLAQSLLVSVCFHEEEFEKTLKTVLKKIKTAYKKNKRNIEPKILVEEFMEGEMYSIDGYVSSKGRVNFCPLVHVKTGRSVGFDDFFAYQTIVPTTLSKEEIAKAEEIARASIHALGLRNITTHVELLKTDRGWKVIELGPRIGGFRNKLYNLSYGIDHSTNDVLVRMGKKVEIPKKKKGYAATLKIYSKKEGRLKALKGIKKIERLVSFVELKRFKQIGDMCRFAKHGGKSVCNIHLFNKSRSDLLADIRRVEQSIDIIIGKRS